MNIQKVKSTVKKITRLLNQLTNEASAIEKDLILEYLRTAYDQALTTESEIPASNFEPEPNAHSLPEKENPPPPEPSIPPSPVMETDPQPTLPRAEITAHEKPTEFNQPDHSSALLNLFKPLTAHDLSEKLGAQPIRSLKQAFSINDRLLYTNDLFEKNADLFADTLKMVDNYESWEPAKSVLLNLATQFHWEKGEKSEIARQFIKTIQRKFT